MLGARYVFNAWEKVLFAKGTLPVLLRHHRYADAQIGRACIPIAGPDEARTVKAGITLVALRDEQRPEERIGAGFDAAVVLHSDPCAAIVRDDRIREEGAEIIPCAREEHRVVAEVHRLPCNSAICAGGS